MWLMMYPKFGQSSATTAMAKFFAILPCNLPHNKEFSHCMHHINENQGFEPKT